MVGFYIAIVLLKPRILKKFLGEVFHINVTYYVLLKYIISSLQWNSSKTTIAYIKPMQCGHREILVLSNVDHSHE